MNGHQSDEQHALSCICSRANLLIHDSLDLAVWARQSGNDALITAAAQFARARNDLYTLANAGLVAGEAVSLVEAEEETGR